MRGPTTARVIAILAGAALSRQVPVQSQDSLRLAMRDAVAGDTILVAPGTYTGSTSQSGDPGNLPNGTGYFWIGNDGTALRPIVVVAQDPARPPVLQGTTVSSGYVVHVTGDHVKLKNLILQTGDKVLMFDNASHGLVEDCELRNSGNELLHIRDASSNVVVHRSLLHNSGNVAPNFGEGIYIGTDQARWGADDVPQTGTVAPWWGDKAVSEGFGGYDWRVHGTKVECNRFHDISAEPIDVKEGTQYTEVTGNVFDGDSTGRKGGAAYFDYVDSYVDQKGVKGIFRNNVFYPGTNTGLPTYIAEVKRSFPHIPTDLTPAAHASPWCDAKVSVDSNICLASENTVATAPPADPRPSCKEAYLDFHSPDYGGTTGIRSTAFRPAARSSTRIVLDSRFQTLQILDAQGRLWSPMGKSSRE